MFGQFSWLFQLLKPWWGPWSCLIIWVPWMKMETWPHWDRWWQSSHWIRSSQRWSSPAVNTTAQMKSSPLQPCCQVRFHSAEFWKTLWSVMYVGQLVFPVCACVHVWFLWIIFFYASRFQQSLTQRASVTENCLWHLDCWLTFGLVQNSIREGKLKCKLTKGRARFWFLWSPEMRTMQAFSACKKHMLHRNPILITVYCCSPCLAVFSHGPLFSSLERRFFLPQCLARVLPMLR